MVGRIELLAEKTQRSIDLLKERRSALITAAVTGQIDLREATCDTAHQEKHFENYVVSKLVEQGWLVGNTLQYDTGPDRFIVRTADTKAGCARVSSGPDLLRKIVDLQSDYYYFSKGIYGT